MLCPNWKSTQCYTTWASQHLNGCKITCPLFYFFVLVLTNGILINTLESLSAFLIGIITDTSTGGLQGGEIIKAVIWGLWGKQEVDSFGFLSSFKARRMA